MSSIALRRAAFLTAIVLGALVIALPFFPGRYVASPSIGAFRAFYCAGRSVGAARDPYLVEPLRSCEESVFGAAARRGVVEPAPLPPFVLAAFSALALLPFGAALAAWVTLLVFATGAAVWSLHRITGYDVIFLSACLLWSDLYRNIAFAQIPPLVIGILCISAYLLERGNARIAALVAAAALIEPHVAVPCLAALFVTHARARIPLVLTGAALAIVSVVAVGYSVSIEYFTKVLPAHAASEIGANDQYSLTWLLHQMHVSDHVALALGDASYVVMSIAGVLVARRLAAQFGRPALLVLVPAAFAMIGGNFIHDIQIPIALPAALVLLSVVPGRLKPVVLGSIGALAISWLYAGRLPTALQIIILGALVATAPIGFPARNRRYAAVAAACVAYVAVLATIHALPDATASPGEPALSGAPGAIASERWGRYVRSSAYGQASPRLIAAKVPLETGLLLLSVLTVLAPVVRSGGDAKADRRAA